jgi:hypothetical protein
MSDPVNKPAHYTKGGIEALDAIEASMSEEAFCGFLKGNVMKYLWRYRDKGGLQDLNKALYYLNRLIKVEEAREKRTAPRTEGPIPERPLSPFAKVDPTIKVLSSATGEPYPKHFDWGRT